MKHLNNQKFQFSDEAKKKEEDKKKGMVDMFSQDSDMFSEHYHVSRHLLYNQSFLEHIRETVFVNMQTTKTHISLHSSPVVC